MYNIAMIRPFLNDPDIFPDDIVLAKQLGQAWPSWDAFKAALEANVPSLPAEWRYYDDGKTWLCKVTHKADTVCWVSAWKKFFKVSFYFTAKAEAAINASSLDAERKHAFLHPKGKCSLRAVSIEVKKKSDLDPIKELIGIKLKLN
jgi:hypothetical protein